LQQKEMLMDLGCYQAQGYLFGKPESMDKFSQTEAKGKQEEKNKHSADPIQKTTRVCRNGKDQL